MQIGDRVHIIRGKAEGRGKKDEDFLCRNPPTKGTVVFQNSRFLVVAFSLGNNRLYREAFWPEQVHLLCSETGIT